MRAALRAVLLRGASTGLDLNFAGGVFSLNNTRTASPAAIPGWSFSRTDTNGTATALDLAGNVIQFPSRTNLLLQSQTFDNASWTKQRATVTANATTAPDGSMTADKLVEDNTASNNHRTLQNVSTTGQPYAFSVFAKASERSWMYLRVDRAGPSTPSAWFNLSAGTVGTVQTGLTASIQALPNGWYRCSVAVDTADAVNNSILLGLATADNNANYNGDNTSGIFVWGAQLETGSTATDYIPTTTAAVTVVLPRITNRGILVEEARTNQLLNSATLSTQTVTTTAVPHTLSFYGTGTVTLTGASTAGPLVGTGANNRVTLTFTPLAAPLVLTVTGSVTTAQLEAGAFATSPIITTGAAGTRGADDPVLNPLAFSQPFTIAAEWDLPLAASVGVQNIANWTNATGFLRRIRAGLSTTAFQLNNDSNVNDVNITAAGPTAAGVGRAALRAQTNNAAAALNGTLLGSDTSCDIATMTILRVGSNATAEPLNGYVRRIRVLPTAATDAQLQSLSAP
jgi:hypothetical protein